MIARAAVAALALLLGACALAPSNPDLPELAGVPNAFEVSGRLALRDGQRNEIAKLRWTHRGTRDTWIIASPLGNELARIDSEPGLATLTQASGGGVQAESFADLTERALGVPVDVADLARWLHGGKPDPKQGWTVAIEETQKAGAVDIARRMSATRGDMVLRLVVDDYRALPD